MLDYKFIASAQCLVNDKWRFIYYDVLEAKQGHWTKQQNDVKICRHIVMGLNSLIYTQKVYHKNSDHWIPTTEPSCHKKQK